MYVTKYECGVPEWEQLKDDFICPLDEPYNYPDCRECCWVVEREEEEF